MRHLRKPVLERLMQYYRLLQETAAGRPLETVTSAQLGEALDIDPTQVRKDFAALGVAGIGRVGFDVRRVCQAIEHALGFDRPYEAVLIGTGHLGSTLLAYSGFDRYGLHIAAAFDRQATPGTKIAGRTVRSMRALKPFIQRHRIPLAILAPPTDATEPLAARLIAAGVKAIWNFTPRRMPSPPRVLVRNEQHFSIGLSEIGHYLQR